MVLNIKNPEILADAFSKLVQDIQFSEEEIRDDVEDKGDYFIVMEENRAGSHFVHIVPKELYDEFRVLQTKRPQDLVGSAILVGRKNGKEIYATIFGIHEFFE